MALTKVIGEGLGNLDENITFSTASKGVHLGVTSATSSNLLDDYEEGTHTFVEVSGQASITNNRSHYTKIGRLVAVQASITVGSNSNSNPLNLSLPFSSNIDGYYLGGGNISYTSMSATYINDNLRPLIANAAADVSFIGGANAGGSALTCAAVSGARIDFHILYFV